MDCVFARQTTLSERRVGLEDYAAGFAGLEEPGRLGYAAENAEFALVDGEGDTVFGEFVGHGEHVFGVVVGYAHGLGEAFVYAVGHAFGDCADALHVNGAVDEIYVYVIQAEILK